jgi:hypothetical protein
MEFKGIREQWKEWKKVLRIKLMEHGLESVACNRLVRPINIDVANWAWESEINKEKALIERRKEQRQWDIDNQVYRNCYSPKKPKVVKHYTESIFTRSRVQVISCNHHHIITISSPSHHHLITISSPYHHHLIAISSPSHHHIITISSPYHHHLITISLPSHCHESSQSASIFLLSYHRNYRLLTTV